jgi:VWFA-related protein
VKTYLALALGLWLAAAPASAQDAGVTASTLKLTSQLVVLDVSVIDKAGNPVESLGRDDFTVYEAGQPQTIRSFDPPATHKVAATLAAESVRGMADVQRLMPAAPVTLLVLDELNTEFTDMAFARSAVAKYLNAQPPTLTQPTALLVATDTSFAQVLDYTLDRAALLTALKNLKAVYPFQRMRSGNSGEGKALRFAETLSSLQQIAQASSGHKGRKNVIWVGTGFPSIDLRNAPDHQIALVKGVAERTVNLLRDDHVTVYTINPAITSSGVGELDVIDDAATDEVHNRKDPFDGTVSFNTLAPETGGRAFSLGNGVDKEIAASLRDGNSFYTLSYVPSARSNAAQEYRGIVVRVNRPGLIARTRKGYFAAVPAAPPKTLKQGQQSLGFDLGTAVASKMMYTGLTVLARPGGGPGQYTLEVATGDLAWSSAPSGEASAQVIVAAVALDAKDKPVGKVVDEATARLAADRPLTSVPFVPLSVTLPLPANAVRIRFVVRDSVSGQLGTADVSLTHGATR